MRRESAYYASAFTLIALIVLCAAWELWLAPLRPGGSWLALKILPLLAPLRGILRRERYTYQWSSLLILAYLAEGAVRAWTEPQPGASLAIAEIVLSAAFFCAVIAFVRSTRRP